MEAPLLGTAGLEKNQKRRLEATKACQARGVLFIGATALLCIAAYHSLGEAVDQELLSSSRPDSLAAFAPSKIYRDERSVDQQYPNRIDAYGCLFSKCEEAGGDPLWMKGRALLK
eukprot:3690389-Rhodomonas_salina.1